MKSESMSRVRILAPLSCRGCGCSVALPFEAGSLVLFHTDTYHAGTEILRTFGMLCISTDLTTSTPAGDPGYHTSSLSPRSSILAFPSRRLVIALSGENTALTELRKRRRPEDRQALLASKTKT